MSVATANRFEATSANFVATLQLCALRVHTSISSKCLRAGRVTARNLTGAPRAGLERVGGPLCCARQISWRNGFAVTPAKSFLRSAPLIMHRSVLDHAPCALVPPTGLLAGRMVCGEIWANPAPRRARFRQLQLIAIGGTGQPSVLDLAISGRLDGISDRPPPVAG